MGESLNRPAEKLLESLQERAKELNCLYEIEEVLSNSDASLESVFKGIVRAIPPGWQYADFCFARITFEGTAYTYNGGTSKPTPWALKAPIMVQGKSMGYVEVYYTKELPKADEGPFLKEEVKLINTIAERVSHFILHKHLKQVIHDWDTARENLTQARKGEWRVVIDLLRRTDQELFIRIARKMMNYLCWNGINEAEEILQRLGSSEPRYDGNGGNRPLQRSANYDILQLSEDIFRVADKNLSGSEILHIVQKWMQEDRASFLVRTLINLDSSLTEISDAIRRFHHLSLDTIDLPDSTRKGLKVALVRRFLSDQLEFIQIAKNYVEIKDFIDLIPRVIHPVVSHGKLGGKSAGLFLAARILRKNVEDYPELTDIKIPKTWYITSDGLHSFMHYNNLEEVTEQKYKEIDQVRQEYPHIIHLFKNSHFPPEIVQGLSMALDDFGEVPLIVRSSSLLEDRLGAAFSGKYESLFLANQGTKRERLEALMDAIAEVYSSTFGSDPIEYRAERGLLDFHEEMGILIQEVVGTRVGKFFAPSFAGVAFSNNEFRWSPRIRREDGLIRMVPGLGTRAVDRLSDDYSILVAPGQPGLKVNVTLDETLRYSPRYMDVINLDTNEFETIPILDFMRDSGGDLPGVEKIVSLIEDDHLKQPSLLNLDFERDDLVITFDGLIRKTPFIKQMRAILDVLQEKLSVPVDIEFAHDGKNFYLLQCRPQSYSLDTLPAPIPKDIPESAIVFTANRYVSNGQMPDISHIVYVDPLRYSEVENQRLLKEIGRVVSQLNKQLPKRQFVLMGPGRWGSRGDIKLGVSVTYSDINNTAMLVEIAKKKGNYVPDLSFGTHFFQDLVEASIRYLPLYPDDPDTIFNENFLTRAENMLPKILPEHAHLSDTVRVIDVPGSTQGKVLRIFMNADLDEAVGVLTQPASEQEGSGGHISFQSHEAHADDHWRWRYRMAERIAQQIEPGRFGVKAFYIFGSTKNGTAGPGSDIDLLLHVDADDSQRLELQTWLEGWSVALDEMNYLRTGYRSGGLLDVHLVTDEDIEKRSSYAVKIGAVTDAAKELTLGVQEE